MNVFLSPTLVSDDYAPQRAGHASLPGPTASLVTELLQLPVPGYGTVYCHISEMLTYHTVGSGGTKDIFVWIVGHGAVWTILNAFFVQSLYITSVGCHPDPAPWSPTPTTQIVTCGVTLGKVGRLNKNGMCLCVQHCKHTRRHVRVTVEQQSTMSHYSQYFVCCVYIAGNILNLWTILVYLW